MKPQQVRIISGQWRSRKIPVLSETDLRPTPNRVRETLFNWLRPYIVGARCLDLFAGSGALSFEALSQGASQVVCIEQSKLLIEQLQSTAETLNANRLKIIHANALEWIQAPPTRIDPSFKLFNIVFLDPPYAANLLNLCFKFLQNGWLSANALIYFEHAKPVSLKEIPNTWQIVREKKAGQIYYYLAQAIEATKPVEGLSIQLS